MNQAYCLNDFGSKTLHDVSLLPTSNGIPYLPDGHGLVEPPPRPWPTWVRIAIFVICYVALQGLYARSTGTVVEQFFLETAGSRPAAALIDLLQPDVHAQSVGTRVTASNGGGINIGNGCEGTDLYFLLFAAFAAVHLSWRLRALGFGLGLGLAFVLNQVRIFALFHAYRSDHALFDLLHTTVAPVLLVIALVLYFHAWLHYSRRPGQAAA
jgi:exosortase/archaeosortase family protein